MRTEQQILEDLRDVEYALSPENLSGDGEFSRSKVNSDYKRLKKQRAKLVAELGREPLLEEIYGC